MGDDQRARTANGARRYRSEPVDTSVEHLQAVSSGDGKAVSLSRRRNRAPTGSSPRSPTRQGRTSRSATFLWVWGTTRVRDLAESPTTTRSSSSRTRTRYEVGDTAEVLVPAPFPARRPHHDRARQDQHARGPQVRDEQRAPAHPDHRRVGARRLRLGRHVRPPTRTTRSRATRSATRAAGLDRDARAERESSGRTAIRRSPAKRSATTSRSPTSRQRRAVRGLGRGRRQGGAVAAGRARPRRAARVLVRARASVTTSVVHGRLGRSVERRHRGGAGQGKGGAGFRGQRPRQDFRNSAYWARSS